jgi:dienelactone hydrolase
MRPLEITLLLVNLPILIWCLSARGRSVWLAALTSFAMLVMVLQIAVEGRRWQFDPAYVASVWPFASSILKRPAKLGRWISLAAIGCLLLATALSSVLPAFHFPTPSGPFPIGTVTRHLVDPNRMEFLGPDPGAHRELMIQIWYPSDYRGSPRSYRSRSEVSFFKEHLSLIMTNAAAGNPPSRTPGRYPVLIFDHSWVGRRDECTFLVENLASHGYVVVGMDHPYGSKFTAFPNGRVVYSTLGDWMDFSSDESQSASLRIAETQLKVRVADASFVLDTLGRLDQFDPSGLLTGHLDTSKAAIIGFSFGGAVAAEACRRDRRFRAAVDLDGCLFGESAKEGVERPFLVMSDDNPDPSSDPADAKSGPKQRRLAFIRQDARNVMRSLQTHGGFFVGIKGARHMNFCDSPLFLPLRPMSEAGPIDARRAMRIIDDYTVAFFDGVLYDRPAGVMKRMATEYPEVRFSEWKRPSSLAGFRVDH